MARRVTDEERIEQWFTNASTDEATHMLDKVRLILRVRGVLAAETPKRRGRKPKERQAPPIGVTA